MVLPTTSHTQSSLYINETLTSSPESILAEMRNFAIQYQSLESSSQIGIEQIEAADALLQAWKEWLEAKQNDLQVDDRQASKMLSRELMKGLEKHTGCPAHSIMLSLQLQVQIQDWGRYFATYYGCSINEFTTLRPELPLGKESEQISAFGCLCHMPASHRANLLKRWVIWLLQYPQGHPENAEQRLMIHQLLMKEAESIVSPDEMSLLRTWSVTYFLPYLNISVSKASDQVVYQFDFLLKNSRNSGDSEEQEAMQDQLQALVQEQSNLDQQLLSQQKIWNFLMEWALLTGDIREALEQANPAVKQEGIAPSMQASLDFWIRGNSERHLTSGISQANDLSKSGRKPSVSVRTDLRNMQGALWRINPKYNTPVSEGSPSSDASIQSSGFQMGSDPIPASLIAQNFSDKIISSKAHWKPDFQRQRSFERLEKTSLTRQLSDHLITYSQKRPSNAERLDSQIEVEGARTFFVEGNAQGNPSPSIIEYKVGDQIAAAPVTLWQQFCAWVAGYWVAFWSLFSRD